MLRRLALLFLCFLGGVAGYAQAYSAQSAEEYKKEAERLRYLQVAQRMALKSKELGVLDKELQALLAQHAYLFSKEHNGYPYDRDIYSGLLAALKSHEDPQTLPLYGHRSGGVRTLVTHPTASYALSGGGDGRILRWTFDGSTWKAETFVDQRQDVNVHSLAVSPDGRWLASAGNAVVKGGGNYVEIYDLDNKAVAPRRITGYQGTIDNLKFTPDGRGFYARDNSGRSVRYTEFAGSASKEVIKTTEKLHAIALSPDGNQLAGVSEAGNLLLWATNSGYAETAAYSNFYREINKTVGLTALSYSPDGKNIVVGDDRGVLRVLPAGGSSSGRILTGHVAPVEQIIFNHQSTFMATCSKDKTVRLWNLAELERDPIVMDHADWVWSATFTKDDKQLLAGLHGIAITLQSWPTGMEPLSGGLCGYVSRNLTNAEWETFVGKEYAYEITCPNKKQ